MTASKSVRGTPVSFRFPDHGGSPDGGRGGPVARPTDRREGS